MRHITAAACALTIALPALAAAQIPTAEPGRSGRTISDAIHVTSRPLPAKAYAAVPGLDPAAQSCRVDTVPQQPEPEDSRWTWRLRAYRHLDCVVALVDDALRGAGTDAGDHANDTAVRLSRADLERIRTLAWWARDAAARIGQ